VPPGDTRDRGPLACRPRRDHNVVNGVTDDPDFPGDSGIPAAAGHYAAHPAPGVSDNIQVSFRPAK
jgi:hypothetical protein